MTAAALSSLPVILVAMAVAGLGVGSLYFLALRRSIVLLAARREWLGPAALTLGRLAAMILFLAFAAKLGATSLLAAFCGFLAARAIALRHARRIS
jgi:hypothetical protein